MDQGKSDTLFHYTTSLAVQNYKAKLGTTLSHRLLWQKAPRQGAGQILETEPGVSRRLASRGFLAHCI